LELVKLVEVVLHRSPEFHGALTLYSLPATQSLLAEALSRFLAGLRSFATVAGLSQRFDCCGNVVGGARVVTRKLGLKHGIAMILGRDDIALSASETTTRSVTTFASQPQLADCLLLALDCAGLGRCLYLRRRALCRPWLATHAVNLITLWTSAQLALTSAGDICLTRSIVRGPLPTPTGATRPCPDIAALTASQLSFICAAVQLLTFSRSGNAESGFDKASWKLSKSVALSNASPISPRTSARIDWRSSASLCLGIAALLFKLLREVVSRVTAWIVFEFMRLHWQRVKRLGMPWERHWWPPQLI
jgi:hypothetical protein